MCARLFLTDVFSTNCIQIGRLLLQNFCIGKTNRKYFLGNWNYNNDTSTFMTEIECSSKWHIFITTCPHPILLAIQIKRVWIELLTQKSLSINMISTWSGKINPTSRNEKYLFTSKSSYSYIIEFWKNDPVLLGKAFVGKFDIDFYQKWLYVRIFCIFFHAGLMTLGPISGSFLSP